MKRRLWSIFQIVLGLIASAGLGWLAARGLDWDEVFASFRDTSLPLLFLSIFMFLGAGYIRAVRWRVLFIGVDISTLRLFIIQNEGIGLNNVMPMRVASEAVQLAVLTVRDKISAAKALATLGMERVVDMVVSTFMLGVAFFFVPELENFTIFVWGAVAFAIFSVVLVRFVAWSGGAVAFVRRISFVNSLADAIRTLERERGRLLASMLLSVAYWLAIGISAWTIAVAIGLPITPMTATLVIMGAIFFTTSVPAAPGAVGTFEFGIVYVLEFFGVSRESAFGFAVITHAIFFMPPTIIAAVFLPREGLVSVSRVRSLASRFTGVGHHS